LEAKANYINLQHPLYVSLWIYTWLYCPQASNNNNNNDDDDDDNYITSIKKYNLINNLLLLINNQVLKKIKIVVKSDIKKRRN